ncbi:protein-export chaperone SecB [Staphylococcus shinii]|uniref:protein-export chaperone SecB n=1 Tax=Staphylococcus shinii TaxID=2912228 RepID=UPI00351948E3
MLKFSNYEVEETRFRKDLNATQNSDELSPTVECNIMRKKDNENEMAIRLSIEIGEDNQESSLYVFAKVVGFFEQEDEGLDLSANAVAILFPYVRSLVSDLTSKGSDDPIILPPINVNTLLEKDVD